jgi:hypothetical protein
MESVQDAVRMLNIAFVERERIQRIGTMVNAWHVERMSITAYVVTGKTHLHGIMANVQDVAKMLTIAFAKLLNKNF